MTQMIDSIQEPIARQVREAVRQHYAVAAESGSCCGDGGDCCGTSGAATVDVALDSLCLLYTSDAADERSSVDLGGRRIIKKKKKR